MDFVRTCWTVVVPLLLIIVIAIVLFAIGYRNAAWMVSTFGTVLVMFLNVLYVTLWHSRSRWLGLTWSQRLTKIASFER
jgi:hypothetical protein